MKTSFEINYIDKLKKRKFLYYPEKEIIEMWEFGLFNKVLDSVDLRYPRSIEMFRKHFFERQVLREIAEYYDLSQTRIQQLIFKALRYIAKEYKRHFRPYEYIFSPQFMNEFNGDFDALEISKQRGDPLQSFYKHNRLMSRSHNNASIDW